MPPADDYRLDHVRVLAMEGEIAPEWREIAAGLIKMGHAEALICHRSSRGDGLIDALAGFRVTQGGRIYAADLAKQLRYDSPGAKTWRRLAWLVGALFVAALGGLAKKYLG